MSLFSSLYTGTAGMLAQERSTAVISENIANINTTGYKRQDVAFHDMVFDNNRLTLNNNGSGSVFSTRINRIDQQGGIQQTASSTDLAINGNGFFAVRPPGADVDARFLYTRNGTFQEDGDGILTNSAGYQLYGWPIDQDGNVASGSDTTSLELVDIDLFQTTATPTTSGELALNLNSNELNIDPQLLNPPQTLPVSAQAVQFSRSVAVYDEAGTERRVNFEFRKVPGPMAHFNSNTGATLNGEDALIDPLGNTSGILANDILQISDGVNTLDVTFVNAPADPTLNQASTLNEAISVINAFTDGAGTQLFTASRSDSGGLLVQANDPTANIDITGSSATVLGVDGFNIVADPVDGDFIYGAQADLLADGAANPNQTAFPAFADSTTPNPFTWWEVRVTTIDPADPSGTASVEVSKGLINFDGNGSLNAVTDADGQALLDLGTLTFDNADPTSTVTMTFDIANFTQLSGEYNVLLAEQNGAPLGEFVGVEITRDGIVESIFSNGERVPSFQIPIADFVNANGLERISGTAFAETEDSGAVEIFEAGDGGTGVFQSASLENSNVDLSNEFSMLIVNQRAFSLNSRLITTVDEMTELTGRLKR